MFTVGERDRLQEQLFARAEADSAITGGALTGSNGAGEGDRWSDIDLVLAVRGEFGPVMPAAASDAAAVIEATDA